MIISTWKKAWAILARRQRILCFVVLGLIIIGAVSASVMVGSVMPFLSVLSDPSRIETTPALEWAYNHFMFTSTYMFLVGLGLASISLIFLSSMLQILKTWTVSRFTISQTHFISLRLLTCYLSQPYSYFLNRHTSDMAPRILTESQQVAFQFLRPVANFISACLTTGAIIILLFWVEPFVSLVSFAVIGGIYGAIYIFTRRILVQLGRVRVRTNQERFRFANEALAGLKDIKLVGRERAYIERFARPSLEMAQTQVLSEVLQQLPPVALQAIALSGVIILSLVLIDPSAIDTGDAMGGVLPIIGVFAFAAQRLMPELAKLYGSLAQMQAGSAAVNAVYEDLVLHQNPHKLPETAPIPLGLKTRLSLENISYSYPNADQAGISDVTLSIAVGEKIGIVGSTGAGKTTLADIILGLLEPDQGRLVADDVEITQDTLRAWMQSLGYVPQDIFLTDAAVGENIALGVPPEQIDQARLKEAARIARIDDFIMTELPDGYETFIGERGVRLSGGQRQRIGIARALYHDADMIIFDEATSALDNLTEAEVIDAIDALPGDKTVLMIAHRLSTVQRCDRIIVLNKGRVVGCDTWSKLIAENEAFQRIAAVAQAA